MGNTRQSIHKNVPCSCIGYLYIPVPRDLRRPQPPRYYNNLQARHGEKQQNIPVTGSQRRHCLLFLEYSSDSKPSQASPLDHAASQDRGCVLVIFILLRHDLANGPSVLYCQCPNHQSSSHPSIPLSDAERLGVRHMNTPESDPPPRPLASPSRLLFLYSS